jgi:hypothetical protein
MKTQPNIPQNFVDQTVERILLTGEDCPNDDQAWPALWRSADQVNVIADLSKGRLRYVGHGDINQRWREVLYQQKRNAGRKYFSAPPTMVPAELLLNLSDTAPEKGNLATITQPEANVVALEQKIRVLEMQLESHRPYLQLYRLGAGSLLVAVLSLVVWLLTGTGIPFHPIFAIGVIPAAIGVIAMAFLIRSSSKDPKRK